MHYTGACCGIWGLQLSQDPTRRSTDITSLRRAHGSKTSLFNDFSPKVFFFLFWPELWLYQNPRYDEYLSAHTLSVVNL